MKWLLFFTLIFATGFPAMARKPATAEIYSGHITDGQGNGVEYATIVLLQDEIQKQVRQPTTRVISPWKQKQEHIK